ncbi:MULTISPECIES: cbb3-type cytochrome oxidase assembly protein CcoS [Thalassolituus]|jgi:cbb3-type cytochrome oxidase maturation protein|uniref:cbb3-type cytochrome oxidase assembly protein CcoS n=1 Tax=Thalassolituus TaxID=187492 RepID=UPI000C61FBD3|nr:MULTISPECIES: cbb3-type cytochrome oxidase assembly protein CcoS [Thalassolituus]MAX87208.1 cbb3-type cytochrome oxidase assembly protein CcoS [Oceanospirillaceae bacterium]MED5441210.1 cbb3-type cytochrome oxidase assembly protein CcoS [Pseudomonadota bacterium]HCG79497.1 cbb3-type cytochrome oxidase assembly protein CcoS [Oceanospirillales bacterium]|tara:strand:+ start:145 stop:378 length:234 start_codon:yes stop_codon:yes gene_type:complete
MDIIYVLVPLSIALLAIAVAIFFWAVKGGQFDDLDSPAHKILFDDDEYLNERREDSVETNSDADSESDGEPKKSKND